MDSEIHDIGSQILMNVVNNHHNQNRTGYFTLSDFFKIKVNPAIETCVTLICIDRGKHIYKYWVCSFEFLDLFYLLFVIFFLISDLLDLSSCSGPFTWCQHSSEG